MPKSKQEIAVDRMYADNNHICVGDLIGVGSQMLTVSGLVALSDYSALFSDNTDMMFDVVNIFAVVLFILLIYLLTKLIIEKNTAFISMVKILGYENGEIARLYLLATTWAVVLSIGVSLMLQSNPDDLL